MNHTSHIQSGAINGCIYKQDSVSCRFSFCLLGAKRMAQVRLSGCRLLSSESGCTSAYWSAPEQIGQLSVCGVKMSASWWIGEVRKAPTGLSWRPLGKWCIEVRVGEVWAQAGGPGMRLKFKDKVSQTSAVKCMAMSSGLIIEECFVVFFLGNGNI